MPYACPAPSFAAGLFYWLILKRQGGLDETALELIETTHVKREGETDMQSSIRFFATAASLVILLTAAWLVINGVPANAQDPPAREETSVKVTVDGAGPNRNVAKGDVVDNGEKTEGVDCTIPDLTIEMGGDVEKVLLAVDNDTCDTYVKDIVEAEDFPDDPNSQFSVTAGYEWRVGAITRVVGFNSIDTLTRTTGEVDFKMASFTGGGSVYDGNNRQEDCWGNHTVVVFQYYEDTCSRSASSLGGPSSIYNQAKGVYTNRVISSWGHTTWAKAKARGYHEMPHVFHATCRGQSLPPSPAMLECELEHEYLGDE